MPQSSIGLENEKALAPGTYRLSPKNTQIAFIGSAIANSHEGEFKQFRGQFSWPDNPQLTLQIQMDSVFTKIDLLTTHLKADDFFDVAKFPTASFESTGISADGDHFLITGKFTIHGITQTQIFPARIQESQTQIHLDAKFTIRQSDFKMQSARTTTDDVPVNVECRIGR